jgi:hypothetical protein
LADGSQSTPFTPSRARYDAVRCPDGTVFDVKAGAYDNEAEWF